MSSRCAAVYAFMSPPLVVTLHTLTRMGRGFRVAAPLFPAAFVLGASFGVLALASGFSAVAAIVMSMTTFAGSSQVATVSVLGAGGGVAAAIVAALLLNARYAPIGITIARTFRGSVPRRLVEA